MGYVCPECKCAVPDDPCPHCGADTVEVDDDELP